MGVGESRGRHQEGHLGPRRSRQDRGPKAAVSKARKSIATLHGARRHAARRAVTLRKTRMYEFPTAGEHRPPRVRDFRGLNRRASTGAAISRWGSRSTSCSRRSITTTSKRLGHGLIVCTSAKTDDEARALLKAFDFRSVRPERNSEEWMAKRRVRSRRTPGAGSWPPAIWSGGQASRDSRGRESDARGEVFRPSSSWRTARAIVPNRIRNRCESPAARAAIPEVRMSASRCGSLVQPALFPASSSRAGRERPLPWFDRSPRRTCSPVSATRRCGTRARCRPGSSLRQRSSTCCSRRAISAAIPRRAPGTLGVRDRAQIL